MARLLDVQRVQVTKTLASHKVAPGADPVPIAHVGIKEEGLRYLHRLASGDRTALSDLQVDAPDDYDTTAHE